MRTRTVWLVAGAALLAAAPLWGGEVTGAVAPFAGWTVQPAQDGGVLARAQYTDAMRSTYAFWGPAWGWQDVKITALPPGPAAAKFSIGVADLGVTILGTTSATKTGLVIDYDVTTARSVAEAVGGGIEFFLTRSLGDAEPTLLPGNKGFRWQTAKGQNLQVVFSRALADLYFEGGGKDHIRCLFVGPKTPVGRSRFTMTVQLPEGGKAVPARDAAYATDSSAWQADTIVWEKAPVDVSFLNANDRPAGVHGRILAAGEALLDGAGKPLRLWGTNLTGYMLFSGSDENICAQAKRLAALGFNLARLHHHDSDWVQPNVFPAPPASTRSLRPEALAKIDRWVKCLNDEGIYVWLDLHVGRLFKGADKAAGVAEITDANQARAFAFVNPSLERLMHEFAKQYLDRKSTLTGKRYADNPGIFAVQVLNEADLGSHFGPMLYPGGGHPLHEGLFEEVVNEAGTRLALPHVRAKDTWAAGDGKQVLADIEGRFFSRAVANLRGFGCKSLIAVSPTWGQAAFWFLPPLLHGDLIDVHAYGDEEELSRNPRFAAGLLDWIAGARVRGLPLAVSEWGADGPLIRDRFTVPLRFAAVASLQGWNAAMHFAYQQTSADPPDRRDRWASAVDPALLVMMPAAALLFRAGHVQPARRSYALTLTKDQLYGGTNAACPAVRTLTEQSRISIELPGGPKPAGKDKRGAQAVGPERIHDPNKDFLPPGASEITSDTGELKRDFAAGFHTVDTPLSQAAAGWLGGRTIALRDVELRLTTAKAAVAFSSLDGLPLAQSRRWLVSYVAQAVPGKNDALPYLAEPVRGQACVNAGAGAVVKSLGPSGAVEGVVPLSAQADRSCFIFPRGHYLTIERSRP